MSAEKIALSIPADVLARAKREVELGRAKSLSALVSQAIDEKLRRGDLNAILDAMDAEHGRPDSRRVNAASDERVRTGKRS